MIKTVFYENLDSFYSCVNGLSEKSVLNTPFQYESWQRLLYQEHLAQRKAIKCFSIILFDDAMPILGGHFFFKRVGRRRGTFFLGSGGISDYYDFIYFQNEISIKYIDEILKAIECKYHAKNYHLSLVKDSSRIALWAERKGITSYKDNECAAIYCQGNYEDYLSGLSKNVRQNLRTANNRTVTDGREVALVVYNEEPVPEELIQKLRLLYEKRRMIKNQTMNRSHLRYRFTECIRRSNLKKYDITTEAMRSGRGFYLGVLFIDGIPAAFCFGPKSTDDTLCFMQVAIDDMFDRYSPGMLLLTRVFESMLNESGILSIDLTNGNETYKFLLGAKSHYTKCYVFVQ